MNVLTCPDRSDLVLFTAGRLDDDTVNEIASHIETCAACRSTLEEISNSSDPLAASLRQQGEIPFSQEPALKKALEFVQEIGLEASRSPAAMPAGKLPAQLKAIRDYEILGKIGEGGMGAVYKARHARLKKIVAIKVLPADRMEDAHAVARFEREMEAVGKLEHPNIVRAMDAGEADGTHFLVMEYVAGIDLAQLVRQQGPLPIGDACELVRQAALGLQSAHEHGLVHRDIKPSNLILSTSGALKILDLGLALLGGDTGTAGRELTTTGQMMGTLDYMAPEQGSSSHTVDIRADIYSLGATLYKLLTAQAPFGGEKYATPVQKMMALATETPTAVESLRTDVPPELAAIVTKMLARDPNSRYATPAEVAQLLQPFATQNHLLQLLVNEASSTHGTDFSRSSSTEKHLSNSMTGTHASTPIQYVQESTLPTVKALSPNRVAPAPKPLLARLGETAYSRPILTSIATALLLVGGGIVAWQVIIIRDREGNEVARVKVPSGGDFKVIEGAAKPDQKSPPIGPASTNPDRRAAEWMLSVGNSILIQENGPEREIFPGAELPLGLFELTGAKLFANPKVSDEGLAHFENCKRLTVLHLSNARVSDAGLAHFKNCKNLMTVDLRGTKKLSDTGLAHFQDCRLHHLILIDTNVTDAGLVLFKECTKLQTLGLSDTRVSDAGLSHFRYCENLEELYLHNTKVSDAGLAHFKNCKNFVRLELPGTKISDAGLTYLADCPRLAIVNVKNTKVTETGVKKLSAALPGCKIEWDGGVIEPTAGKVVSPAVAPKSIFDALRREDIPPYELAVAGDDDPAKAPPEIVAILGNSRMRHSHYVNAVVFLGENKLASASADGTVKVWNTTNGEQLQVLRHPNGVTSLHHCATDGLLMTTGDMATQFWNLATGSIQQELYGTDAFGMSSDGKRVATRSHYLMKGEGVAIVNPKSGEKLRVFSEEQDELEYAKLSSNGELLATAGKDHAIKIWNADTGERLHTFPFTERIISGTFSPAGTLFATRHPSGTKVFDLTTGSESIVSSVTNHGGGLAFSLDGKHLAYYHNENQASGLELWDLEQKKSKWRTNFPVPVFSIAFSPNGKVIATGDFYGFVRLWDAETGAERRTGNESQTGFLFDVNAAGIVAVGKGCFAGSAGKVELWDLSTQKRLHTLDPETEVRSIAFHPDGSLLATGLGDFGKNSYRVILWDARTGKLRSTLPRQMSRVWSLAFSPDGQSLAAHVVNAGDIIWDWRSIQDLQPDDIVAPKATLAGGSAMAFSAQGDILAAAGDGTGITLWDVKKGKPKWTQPIEATGNVHSLAFHPEGSLLTSAGSDNQKTGARLWDSATGEEYRRFKTPPSANVSIAFSPNGQLMAVLDVAGDIHVFDPIIKIGESPLRWTFHSPGVIKDVKFAADGRHLVTRNGNGTVYVLRLSQKLLE